MKKESSKKENFTIKEIPLSKISTTDNVRSVTTDVADLAESIRNHGIINPITVYASTGKYQYRVIAGHRRVDAAKIAGLASVPCHVVEFDCMDQVNELAIAENVIRMDMTPYEECVAVHSLLSGQRNTPNQIAKRFGRSLRWVLVRDKLAKAGKEVLEKVKNGKIEIKQAAKLADLPDEVFADELSCCYSLGSYEVERILDSHHHQLSKAPFDKSECECCSKCSACQTDLFDEDQKPICLDSNCWKRKVQEFAKEKAKIINDAGGQAVVEEFCYGNDAYGNRLQDEDEIKKAEENGVKKRFVVAPSTGKVTSYYDKRDMPDYHELTDEEIEAQEEAERMKIRHDEAREDLICDTIRRQLEVSVKTFGDSGLLAIIAFAKLSPYSMIPDCVLDELKIARTNYNGIDSRNIDSDTKVGTLAEALRQSLNNIISKIYNFEILCKAWEIFVRDENVPGRASLADIEPTEEEIEKKMSEIEAAENGDCSDEEENGEDEDV